MTKVSIIVPVYNSERYLEACLSSICAQTERSFELLIIDDNSTDASKNIAERYADEDDRIKLFCLDKNQGVANARNVGLDQAIGDYVAFCDSDDFWDKEKLSIQINSMSGEANCISCSNAWIIDADSRINAERTAPSRVSFRMMRHQNFVCMSSLMFCRTMMQSIRFERIIHEDYVFIMKILMKGNIKVLHPIQQNLVYYRRHSNNLTKNRFKSAIGLLRAQRFLGHNTLSLLSSLMWNIFIRPIVGRILR